MITQPPLHVTDDSSQYMNLMALIFLQKFIGNEDDYLPVTNKFDQSILVTSMKLLLQGALPGPQYPTVGLQIEVHGQQILNFNPNDPQWKGKNKKL